MPPSIPFSIIGQNDSVPSDAQGWSAYLNRDKWDDWGKYCTQFYLTIVDNDGLRHGIGQVKIGQRGLKPHRGTVDLPPGCRKPNLPSTFKQLDDDFFSVGQDDDDYAKLTALGEGVREHILSCLCDVAFDKDRWAWAKDEFVMGESLLRSVTMSTVIGQFRRMARGDAPLTRFMFTYSPPARLGDGAPPYTLDFSVDPDSPIPTNVHVLIGRNGVGKTLLLSLMAKALVATDASARQSGKFELKDIDGEGETFANLVAVSFSAFDESELLPEQKRGPDTIGYSYIGLRGPTSDSPTAQIKPKTPNMLAREFVVSLNECRAGARRRRWESMIATLQSDPVFQAAQLSSMIEKNLTTPEEEEEEVLKTFKRLSSGHKIVLLTLTRLVERVEEKTLVLIDEPEAHLHPRRNASKLLVFCSFS